MTTLSPRCGLLIPGDGDAVDFNQMNTNALAIDGFTNVTACTYATRPASPFPDQWIMETDTKSIRRWGGVGIGWQTLKSTGSNVGAFNLNSSSSTNPIAGGASPNYAQIQFSAFTILQRNYNIVAQGCLTWAGPPVGSLIIPVSVYVSFTNSGSGAQPNTTMSGASQIVYVNVNTPVSGKQVSYFISFDLNNVGQLNSSGYFSVNFGYDTSLWSNTHSIGPSTLGVSRGYNKLWIHDTQGLSTA